VGSLYQYYPSKEAIIVRLAERHIGYALDLLARVVRELSNAPVEAAVQTYVRAMLQAHAVEPELHRVLTEQIPRIAGLHWVHTLHQEAEKLVAGWIADHRKELRPVDPKLAAFVLVSAVEAVTHKAVLDRSALLQSDELAGELTALVLAYLRPLPLPN
jgi:AcrR family transcriptional regulator